MLFLVAAFGFAATGSKTAVASDTNALNARSIDAYIETKMLQGRIPGLQLAIVKRGELIYTKSYGLSNVHQNSTVTNTTLFPINSITKAFTGIAVMQLVEMGKISLDSRVRVYLDDVPANWNDITVRDLLTHTSGIPEILDDNIKLIDGLAPDAAWAKIKTLPLIFKPGTKFQYTQTNYLVLGKIIDRVSGEAFAGFIKQGQFDRAEMTNTTFGHSGSSEGADATMYTYLLLKIKDGQTIGVDRAKTLQLRQEVIPPYMRTAAGIDSTAIDMAKWVIALEQGKLLRKSSIDELWRPQRLPDGSYAQFNDLMNGYALGWPVIMRKQHAAVTPEGGERAAVFIYPKDDVAVIVLTNLMGGSPQNFIDGIASHLIPGLTGR
ncbi:MAG: serine hydrolase domain-containing protein [Dyella sp.]